LRFWNASRRSSPRPVSCLASPGRSKSVRVQPRAEPPVARGLEIESVSASPATGGPITPKRGTRATEDRASGQDGVSTPLEGDVHSVNRPSHSDEWSIQRSTAHTTPAMPAHSGTLSARPKMMPRAGIKSSPKGGVSSSPDGGMGISAVAGLRSRAIRCGLAWSLRPGRRRPLILDPVLKVMKRVGVCGLGERRDEA